MCIVDFDLQLDPFISIDSFEGILKKCGEVFLCLFVFLERPVCFNSCLIVNLHMFLIAYAVFVSTAKENSLSVTLSGKIIEKKRKRLATS